jgi:hypothetical protein
MRRYRGFMADSARWERFAFRADDVVISTPSKCGTTWMQMIVGMLLLQRTDLGAPISSISPWLDMLIHTDDEVFKLGIAPRRLRTRALRRAAAGTRRRSDRLGAEGTSRRWKRIDREPERPDGSGSLLEMASSIVVGRTATDQAARAHGRSGFLLAGPLQRCRSCRELSRSSAPGNARKPSTAEPLQPSPLP